VGDEIATGVKRLSDGATNAKFTAILDKTESDLAAAMESQD
jgi:hypothetical protein